MMTELSCFMQTILLRSIQKTGEELLRQHIDISIEKEHVEADLIGLLHLHTWRDKA